MIESRLNAETGGGLVLSCLLALVPLLGEARNAYVETHWTDLPAASQTIKLMNGSTQVGTVTTSSKGVGDTGSTVATDVDPAYPTGGYSTHSQRDYRCKAGLAPMEYVLWANGAWHLVSDTPASQSVLGWNGAQLMSTVTSATPLFTTASDGDPIFDVSNYALSYSASGWSGQYDGSLHYITVSVGTGGCTVEYSSDNASWSTANVGHRDLGTHTVYYRIRKDAYTPVSGSEKVTITEGTILYSASDTEVWHDGQSHSIGLSVLSPSGCTVEYSLTGTGAWTTSRPGYADVGVYTNHFRISKTNYTTATGSRTVTIKALRDMVYSASGYSGTYDGSYHGISVGVTTPASGSTTQYSTSESGNYSASPITYRDVGTNTVWFQIEAEGYKTVRDSRQVVIAPKPIGPDDILNPSYTNYVYSGHRPWYDTDRYWILYGTNYWGVGYWWAAFHGTNNYTGVLTNWYRIVRRDATITSGSASRGYTGSPLTCGDVWTHNFVAEEGLESWDVTGSQTEVGCSPNDFTYVLKPNTDPGNYNLSVVTGRLTVTAVTPVSLRHPVRMEIVGTNRITVGVRETYRSRVVYSDGSSSYKFPNWALTPDDALIEKAFSQSYARLTGYPAGAGSEHALSASYSDSYSTAAIVTNGLVAWYPFDGDTGDRSCYNQALYRYSSSHVTDAKDRTETDGRALRFSGDSKGFANTVSVLGIAAATNALSISAWVKPESYSRLGLCHRSGQFSLRFRENGDWLFNDTTIPCSKALATNAWQLATLTWNGKDAIAWLDGVRVGSAALSGPLGSGSGDFYLGRAIQGAETETFEGSVDDFRLFGQAITADDMALIKSGTDVFAADSKVTVSASKTITVEPHCAIPVAVDVVTATGKQIGTTAFSFSTGCTVTNAADWFGQYAVNSGVHDDAYDYDAAQSGKFTGPGSSWMQTVVTGAGTLSFRWKTDCEQTYDYLVFRDGGRELARLSGASDWRQMTFSMAAGSHAFRWEYVKDALNDVGTDAAWVDRMVWTPVSAPAVPTGRTTLVSATDGTHDNCVYVTWDEPQSQWTVTGYRVLRKARGTDDSTYTDLSGVVTARAFTDDSAAPGVAYTYKVEAESAAGWGNCGTDNGYCAVFLKIDPASHHFSNVPTNDCAAVSVESNAVWKVSCDSWLHVTVAAGGFAVTADANPYSFRRDGTVRVVCGIDGTGSELTYPKTTSFFVTQSAKVDVGFDYPFVDWRTELQITSTNVASAYAPVSVFPPDESPKISFGWRNWSDVEVTLPGMAFRVFDKSGRAVLSWTDRGTGVAEGLTLAKNAKGCCGLWAGGNLKTLPPGDYRLEAELDPENLLDDPNRENNRAVFRFAIRDASLDFARDVLFADCWTNLVVSNGNDFAQAPHVAMRTVETMTNDAPCVYETAAVQFGPYVPMNGVNGRLVEKKKPVDIVFLIDYTGSMDACIAGLVNNIGKFIDRLLVGDSVRGISPIDDLRIKIVGFSDYASDCTYKNWMREYGFTTDRRLLKEQLNELKNQCYGGGGNGGESSYDALWYVCRGWSTVWDGATKPTAHTDTASPFRPLDEAARAVVLFTDEPPLVPMGAPGCSVENGVDDLNALLNEKGVNLTIVGDGWYYRQYPEYAANVHWLSDLVNHASSATNRKLEETYPRTLSDFTQNTADLQKLAETIVLQTPSVATVVEPSFSVAVRGEGTVTFRWCNDSTSTGTNNTFTFACEGSTNLVRYGATGQTWRDEEIVFDSDGLHPLKWTYRKLGYEGAVVDCGLVTDVTWTRRRTELEVLPLTATLDALGTNKVQMTTQVVDNVVTPCKAFGATYDVTCDSIWKVVTNGVPDWIEFVQDNGNGDGNIVLTVSPNESYDQRTAAFTVRAGEYGQPNDDIVEKTVFVVQDGAEPVPGPNVQILSVDVKPRWPWNKMVDVDFRIVLPADGAPATITMTGVNGEGGDMVDDFPVLKQLKECPAKSKVYTGYGKAQGAATTDPKAKSKSTWMEAGSACLTCSNSGWYRISWDMGTDWYNAGLSALKLKDLGLGQYNWDTTRNPWEEDKFHTPLFSVRLKAACAGRVSVEEPSNVVRVDMRLLDVTDKAIDPYSKTVPAGGRILTGIERIGHPDGAVDPKPYDTRDANLFPSNGWNSLDFVEALDRTYSNRYEAACVINDDRVAIEGGTIASNATWTADRIHVVRDNVFVTGTGSLTIEEGAVVKFCDCSHLYVYEDETAAAKTAARHNIVVKGACFTYGYDDSYGGDTLYHRNESTWWNSGQNVVYSQGTADGCTKSTERNKGPDEVEATTYSDWPKERAILRVELKETYRTNVSENAKSVDFKHRYYSYGQMWGALPRPSRDGCTFYGWYTADPNSISASGYRTSTGTMLDVTTYPQSVFSNKSEKIIYALVCPTGWAETLWPYIDAAAGLVRLNAESAVYDGNRHEPEVTRLLVGGELVSPDLYETRLGGGNFVTSGTYRVGVAFKSTYTNSPFATFKIRPRSVEGGMAVLSSASALYVPVLEGGVALPSVKALLPMGAGGELVEIPEADREYVSTRTNWYDLAKDATHYWPRPGTYHVEVNFNGNYSGTLTNEFVIERNPEYDFTGDRFAKATAGEAFEAATNAAKRILYFAGEDPEDAATAYMKSLVTDDIDTNEWVIAKFVCWTGRAGTAEYEKYSAGLDSVACPLVCVLNPYDLETPIVRMCGYHTKEELMDFLAASLTAPVDAAAAQVEIRAGRGTHTYNGAVQKPAAEDLRVTYAGTELAADRYELRYENEASEDVGAYGVWARMKPNVWVGDCLVTGETATVGYEIVPQAVSDDMSAAVRAKLGLGLDPPAAAYNGCVQRPAVTSLVAYASKDYGKDDWFNVGTHTVKVTFASNYCGTVSETFAITARVVSATVVLDRYEETVNSKSTDPLRPTVLRVYEGSHDYVETNDYTVSYGPGSYTTPGTNTVTVTFCGNYAGEASVRFVIHAGLDAGDRPGIEGDPGASVTGDATSGFVITPSAGRNEIVVTIPGDLSPSKVTVMLSPTVTVAKPNGALLRIARGVYSYDINANLDATTNAMGEVALSNATVKAEVLNELFDTAKGAVVNLDPAAPSISVVTREGLLYLFREGETIGVLKEDEAEAHTGTGELWSLPISVSNSPSAFYGVGVEK